MNTQDAFANFSRADAAALAYPPSAGELNNVEHVMARIHEELLVLRTEHAAIARKIGLIKSTIAGLTEVFGRDALPEELQKQAPLNPAPVKRVRAYGLTDACRELLMESSSPKTLKQLYADLQRRYPDLLEHHRHPMAIVQMLLRRLVMYGEAEEINGGAGLRSWKSLSQ